MDGGRLLEASNGLFYGIINYQSSRNHPPGCFEFNPATNALTIKKDLDGYYSEGMIEVSGKFCGFAMTTVYSQVLVTDSFLNIHRLQILTSTSLILHLPIR